MSATVATVRTCKFCQKDLYQVGTCTRVCTKFSECKYGPKRCHMKHIVVGSVIQFIQTDLETDGLGYYEDVYNYEGVVVDTKANHEEMVHYVQYAHSYHQKRESSVNVLVYVTKALAGDCFMGPREGFIFYIDSCDIRVVCGYDATKLAEGRQILQKIKQEMKEDVEKEEEDLRSWEVEEARKEKEYRDHADKIFAELEPHITSFSKYDPIRAPHVDDVVEMCRREGCEQVTVESAYKKLEEIYVPFIVRLENKSRKIYDFNCQQVEKLENLRRQEVWESIPITYKPLNRRKQK